MMKNTIKTYHLIMIVSTITFLVGCTQNPQTTAVIKMDGFTVTWIRDNAQQSSNPVTLFPQASKEMVEELSLQNGIPSSVSVFLLQKDGCNILFDTGLGPEKGLLLESLTQMGLSPNDIDYIYLTHFHGDHIGGMLKDNSAVFPQATVYASQTEYDAWMGMSPEHNAMQVKTMEVYKDNLCLFEFGDILPCQVLTINAVGHTPGHTAFQTGDLLIIGDLMHGAALQMAYPEICATFDMDQAQAAQTRKRLLNYVKEHGLTMAGMHLPDPAFITPEKP